MTRRMRAAGAALALVALASCSSDREPGLASQLGGRFVPALADAPQSAIEAGAPSQDTAILVQVSGLNIVGLAAPVESSGGRTTYLGETGYSVTFEGPVLVATRGFGKDLMAADVSGVRAALAAGGGTATRRHDYLDSLDAITTETFSCRLEPKGEEEIDLGLRRVQTRIISELCEGERIAFENLYYVAGGGEIVASRQFISDIVAYLRNNRL